MSILVAGREKEREKGKESCPMAARRSIFRVSIRDSRGVDGSICDQPWSAGRARSESEKESRRREAHSEYVIDASIQPKPCSYDASKTSGMHNVRNECEMDRFTRLCACEHARLCAHGRA